MTIMVTFFDVTKTGQEIGSLIENCKNKEYYNQLIMDILKNPERNFLVYNKADVLFE